MTGLIPADTKAAAKRGFIRTAAQSVATALGAGISATAILSVTAGEVELVPTLITWGVAALTPVVNGAQSYFSILSKGIPEDYETLD